MRLLVTGAAGFLGSHLVDRLLADGHDVIGMDNMVTGSPQNLTHLTGHPHFRLIHHNVSTYIAHHGALDGVLHFASPASPIDYLELPIQTLKVGALGTHNALGLALAKHARFMLSSTSEVYGDPLVHPQPESYWGNVNPIGPRACYDEGKRCAEALATAYASQYGVEVRIARIFNTYGPRMHENDGRVVSNFIVQALTGQPLTVFGDGKQTRSFCYVSDLIEGFVRLMASEHGSDPVNLGNPRESTMLELATLIREMSGSRSAIVHAPLPKDDPVRRNPNIGRAQQLLGGWTPVVPLEQGIAATIAYFKGVVGQS
jgi:dTDP-glucose 4,6-dehydratase